MRFLRRLFGELRVLMRAKRNRTDYLRWLVRRPVMMAAINFYELALIASNRVDPRLKALAGVKASSLVGCPF